MASTKQTITIPEDSAASPIGGVVVFSAAGSIRKDSKSIRRLTDALKGAGLEVLQISLPSKFKNNLEKSVTSAVARLSRKCGANAHRIALVAEGAAADRAVLGARAVWQLRSFVLLSGRLGQQAKELLTEWERNPVLCLVSSEDKTALRDMTDVYFTSKHPDTDIRVFEGLGRGAGLLTAWTEQFPEQVPLERSIAEWLTRELSLVGRAREVSFPTEDGWEIFGNLLLPDRGDGQKAPGLILLHSGRSDRYVFGDLERLLVRAGFAVLNIDWRGRGKSVNKGRYFDLSKEERANGKLDARAAIDFLCAQTGVDSERIGLVGIVHGAEHAARGSIGDSRVKALALLTGYVPISDDERDYLTSGKVHVMYASGKAHTYVTKIVRELYEATPDKLSRLLIFDGGAIGYQLFELDEKFEPAIVEWLQESLVH